MTIPEFTNIKGWPCKFRSIYKGWQLFRAWDIANDHGKMLYFATNVTPSGGLTILEARNFDGIKKKVSEVA